MVDIDMQPIQDNSTAYLVYQNYEANAKRNGRVFDISYQHFLEMTRQCCEYCGKPPCIIRKRKQKKKNGDGHYHYPDFIYHGIDRVDNSQGYVIGNVVTFCQICNFAKREMTVEQFLGWVTAIYEYQAERIIREVLT